MYRLYYRKRLKYRYNMGARKPHRVVVTASLRAASCNNCVSTSSPGNWTYRTTDPRMKQFFTESMCGYLSGSVTLISVSLILRYWSTECRVPHMLEQRMVICIFVYMFVGIQVVIVATTVWGYITLNRSLARPQRPCRPVIWKKSRTTERKLDNCELTLIICIEIIIFTILNDWIDPVVLNLRTLPGRVRWGS